MQSVIASCVMQSALTYFIEAAKGAGVKEEEQQQQACKQFLNGQTTCKPEGKCSQKKHCLIVQIGQKSSKMSQRRLGHHPLADVTSSTP